jgi:hypothetical protein
MPSLFSITRCSHIQTVEFYKFNFSIPDAALEMTKKVVHMPAGNCTTLGLLIPCELY